MSLQFRFASGCGVKRSSRGHGSTSRRRPLLMEALEERALLAFSVGFHDQTLFIQSSANSQVANSVTVTTNSSGVVLVNGAIPTATSRKIQTPYLSG